MGAGVDILRRRFDLTGQVQGVGFRPFVYRLAQDLCLSGWVVNDAAGVTICVQGMPSAVREFTRRLPDELPPLASIATSRQADEPALAVEKHFEIRPSQGGQMTDAQVTVDTATCGDCLAELADPADPRYAYPFINCTNCGPRYSIVERIPYDRPNTTMRDFELCPLCAREYSDPASRRFHAQPVACGRCGPGLWLVGADGQRVPCADPLGEVAAMLADGKIVAIKGLGGFHLACRADDHAVVARMRQRKGRDAKPFALMVADMSAAGKLCEISPDAREMLAGPVRPIVICPARPGADVAPEVAQGLGSLGIMLPYTPLHHLLFAKGLGPLVMTSGNYSDEPLIKDNDAAVAALGQIADAMLLHDRRIERRVDDSVVQIHVDGSPGVLRRARGYAPRPIRLAGELAGEPGADVLAVGAEPDTPGRVSGLSVLAVGAELKSTVCLLGGSRAVVSEHIGDLKDGRVYRHFIDCVRHLESLYEFTPEVIVADLHPGYLSSDYAERRGRGEIPGCEPVRVVRVQHHYAHIVSCLAEHGRRGPVIGLACDGVGYGDDGASWGCEVFQADLWGYSRLGHLRYLPLPGGDAAARETFRPALAAMYETFGASLDELVAPLADTGLSVDEAKFDACSQMLAAAVNCPPSSSLGRWFDAAAWLCGLAESNRYEAEAPMLLETAVTQGVDEAYDYRIEGAGPFLIDLRPAVEQMVADRLGAVGAGVMAAKFHNTVVAMLAAAAIRAREETALGTVAMSGGCFANRYVTARLCAVLARDGFEVLRHRTIPCNDGGISLGQAVAVAAQMGR